MLEKILKLRLTLEWKIEEIVVLDFLVHISEYIHAGTPDRLSEFIESNIHTPVLPQEFEEFTQLFAAEEKCWLKGSVNIHGMGGTGIPKLNLTSIACLYLSVLTDLPIAKTGSRKNTGIMGSTDFFEELGLMAIRNRRKMLDTFGFVYFDYLELSPWKAYKQILRKNVYVADILEQYHFFEYEIGILGLGISSLSMYDKFLKQIHYPTPNRLFTFSSEVKGRLFDEIIDVSRCDLFGERLTSEDVSEMNFKLVFGLDQDSCWLSALRENVAMFAVELEAATSREHGRELFDKVYADRAVANKIKKISELT